MKDLFDAADGELLGETPARVERRRAHAQRLGRADGEARGCGGEVDLAGFGEDGQEQLLALGAPAREPFAAVFEGDSVEGSRFGEGLVGRLCSCGSRSPGFFLSGLDP